MCAKLEARRGEIEQAVLARIFGVEDPAEIADFSYLEGVRVAASAAFDFALATLESPEGQSPPLPLPLLSQARLAARNGVSVDTVLRRYAAGQALLVDFLIEEVERYDSPPQMELRRLLAHASSVFDHLLAAVSEEHAREFHSHLGSSRERRRAECVERLLAGEYVDHAGLAYDLSGWHVGVAIDGENGRRQLQGLARTTGQRLLLVEPRLNTGWAWLGSERRIDTAEVLAVARSHVRRLRLALGEAARGITGWRLSHNQAKAVLPLARGCDLAVARYADDGLLAAVGRDRTLVDSLQSLYVAPLSAGKSGKTLRDTLQAYFAANCNISSAAAALHVHRQTLKSRLRAIEERIGRPLNDCGVELSIALRLGLFGD